MIPAQAIGRGLLEAGPDSLAQMLVMLRDLNVWNSFAAWAGGRIQGKPASESARRLIEQKAGPLARQPADELRLQVALELASQFGVPPGPLNSARDFDDLWGSLSEGAVTLLRCEDRKFRGDDLTALVTYLLETALREAAKRASESQLAEMVRQVQEHLDQLPEEQLEAVRQALGAERLTAEVVHRALTTGGLAVAIAATAEIAGFSAYIVAVQVLHAVAAVVGLTLPFAAYTTLTSTIAVVASPLLLVPAVVALTWFGARRSNRKLRRRAALLGIMQLALAGVVSSQHDYTGLVAAHSSIIGRYLALRKELETSESTLSGTRASLAAAEAEVANLRTEEETLARQAEAALEEAARLYRATPEGLANLCSGGPLVEEANALREALERQAAAGQQADGFLHAVLGALESTVAASTAASAARRFITAGAQLGIDQLRTMGLPTSVVYHMGTALEHRARAEEVAARLKSAKASRDALHRRQENQGELVAQLGGQLKALDRAYPGTQQRAKFAPGG